MLICDIKIKPAPIRIPDRVKIFLGPIRSLRPPRSNPDKPTTIQLNEEAPEIAARFQFVVSETGLKKTPNAKSEPKTIIIMKKIQITTK